MDELIRRFGLPAVFLLTAVEGDVALVLGGVAAHLGLLDPVAVIAAGALGGFAGDAAWFAAGAWRADLVRRSAAYRRVGPTLERLVGRFGAWQLLLARPVYGTRVATMLFWGTQRLAAARFTALDLPACTVWAILLVSLGYLSSSSVAAVLGRVRRAEEWLGGAVAVLLAVAVTLHVWSRRRRSC